jgi:hypothetical protein
MTKEKDDALNALREATQWWIDHTVRPNSNWELQQGKAQEDQSLSALAKTLLGSKNIMFWFTIGWQANEIATEYQAMGMPFHLDDFLKGLE